MKTSLLSFLALTASFISVHSSPTPNFVVSIQQRQSPDDLITIVTDLYATVQTQTAQINSTAATISPNSTAAEKAIASTAIQGYVNLITNAVTVATAQVPTMKKVMVKRQATSTTVLAGVIETLLLDISGTLNNVISGLGLTAALAIAAPLTTALSNLLLALEVVVNDLLTVVQELVDGLLTGLSLALAGLVL